MMIDITRLAVILRFAAVALSVVAVGLFLLDEKTVKTPFVNSSRETSSYTFSCTLNSTTDGTYYDIVIPLSGKLDPNPYRRVLAAIDFVASSKFKPTDINKQVDKDELAIQLPLFDDRNNRLIPSSRCSVTSQMKITRHEDAEDEDANSGYWMLHTFGPDGLPKQVGGDEFYITFYKAGKRSDPMAIADIRDLNNGTYRLNFVQSPTSANVVSGGNNKTAVGLLEVILEQTCGIGSLPPPLKQNWSVSGAINQFYRIPNVTAPNTILPFLPPNLDHAIDLNPYDQVLVLGDSLLGQFVCAENDRPSLDNCAKFRPKIQKFNVIQAALHNDTLQTPFLMRIRQDMTRLRRLLEAQEQQLLQQQAQEQLKQRLQQRLQQQNNNTNSTTTPVPVPVVATSTPRLALVIGSGVWDILADDTSQGGVDFTNHLQACRDWIETIRREFSTVDIYWKSMTAMHIHQVAAGNPATWATIRRSYYMSTSRAKRLYQLQNQLMANMSIPVLDLYPGTFFAAHMSRVGDGRHYKSEWNQLSLEWFYPPPPPPSAVPSSVHNVMATVSNVSGEGTNQ